jgi:hypothetical protein
MAPIRPRHRSSTTAPHQLEKRTDIRQSIIRGPLILLTAATGTDGSLVGGKLVERGARVRGPRVAQAQPGCGRRAAFTENFSEQHWAHYARQVRDHDEMCIPNSTVRMSLVSVRDVAAVALTTLQDGHAGKGQTITSP